MQAEDNDRSRAGLTVPSGDWSVEHVKDKEELLGLDESGRPVLQITTVQLIETMRLVGIAHLSADSISDLWTRYSIQLYLVNGGNAHYNLLWMDVVRHVGLSVKTPERDFVDFLKGLPWEKVCAQANVDGQHAHEGRPARQSLWSDGLNLPDATLEGWSPPNWPIVVSSDSRMQRLQRIDEARWKTYEAVYRLTELLAQEQVPTRRLQDAIDEADLWFESLWGDVEWLERLLKEVRFGETESKAQDLLSELESFRHRVGRDAVSRLVRMRRWDYESAIKPYMVIDLPLNDAARLAMTSLVVEQWT